jgi:dsRNA-specific ribonuclease
MDIDEAFIRSVFKDTRMTAKYMDVLVSAGALEMYQTAFTSKEFDPDNNYELYEFVGDSVIGEALVWYFYSAFPQLHCTAGIKTINRLKIVHASSESFSEIARALGFLPRIKASAPELADEDKTQHLLEDVLEAFVGVTKIVLTSAFGLPGVGNQVVFNFVFAIFDKKNISFAPEDLYDAKTRLKELFDNRTESNPIFVRFENPVYEEFVDANKTMLTRLVFKKNRSVVFVGEGRTKQAREKSAAQKAIAYLRSAGYKTEKQFAPFCS